MKRVNVRLVTILFVTFFVVAGGSLLLYRFQQSRRTEGLLRIADQKLASHEADEAIKYLTRYILRNKEDHKQVKRLAMLTRDHVEALNKAGTLDQKEWSEAYGILDQCARLAHDDIEVQEAIIDFLMYYQRHVDAIDYLERLIAAHGDKAKPQWRLKLAMAYDRTANYEKSIPLLESMVGWNAAENKFDATKAVAPNEVEAYAALASALRDQRKAPRLADQVIEQMVQQNVDNYKAYVERVRYLRMGMNPPEEQIASDIREALRLAPEEAEPLMLAGEQALRSKDYVRARALFSQCRDLHPDRIEPIQGLFEWAAIQGDLKKGIEYLKEGLKISPDNPGLLFQIAFAQLEAKEFTDYEKSLADFERVARGHPLTQFLKGRRHILEEKWLLGARILSEARQQVQLYRPQLLEQVDRSLAEAYRQLGQADKQLESLTNILNRRPDDIQVRAVMIQCLLELRQESKAIAVYQGLERDLAASPDLAKRWLVLRLQMEMAMQKQLPEANRDWTKAEAMVRELVQQRNVDPILKRTIAADFLKFSGRNEQADEIMKDIDVGDTKNLVVRLNELRRRVFEVPLDQVLQDLDAFEKEVGVSVPTLLLRAEAIALRKPADAQDRLASLEKTGEGLPKADQAIFWSELGKYYVLAGFPPQAQRLWDKALAENPDDLPLQMRLFELALTSGDAERIQADLKRIETATGRDSAEWLWADASRIVAQVRAKAIPESRLENALSHLAEAAKLRSGWPQLYLLEGDIRLTQHRNDLALEAYEKARQLGSPSPDMLRNLVQLYYEQQQFSQAREVLDQLPPNLWTENEQRIQLHLLAVEGKLPEKLELKTAASTAPGFIWLGRLLTDAGRGDEAEQALREALKLEPGSPAAWSLLFLKKLRIDGPEAARALIDEGREQVDEKGRSSFLATSYRLLKDFDSAEPHYLETAEKFPENLVAQQDIASFYLEFQMFDKMRPYIDRILKGQKPHDPNTPQPVRWARRVLASEANRRGTYEGYQEAVALIEENVPEGSPLDRDDLMQLGQITLTRSEVPSHQHLLDQLKKAAEVRSLSFEEKLLLAQSYNSVGDWQGCQTTMTDLLVSHPKDLRVLDPWLRLLLHHDDLQGAARWVDNCPQNSLVALRTRVHLNVRRGRTNEAIAILKQILQGGETPEQQQQQLRVVAALSEELGKYDAKMYDAAESSWRRLVAINPDQTPAYIDFLLRRKDPAKAGTAMELCEKLYGAGKQSAALQRAVALLRILPPTTPQRESFVAKVGQWLDSADPEKVDESFLAIQRSEYQGLTGQAAEQEHILREFLDQHPAKDNARAIVLNNLAYIMALKGKGDEAQQYIDGAIAILGPLATLHDTIGMVRLAQDDPQGAVTAFQTAVDQGETAPLVYVHLAFAHWKAGNQEDASEALRKAQEAGLDESTLGPWEQPMFRELVRALDDAGTPVKGLPGTEPKAASTASDAA